VGYRVIGDMNGPVEVDPSEQTGDVGGLRGRLARVFAVAGAFPGDFVVGAGPCAK